MKALKENKGRARRSFPTRVYQAVWRWHFWASLVITPFLLAVTITGAIYIFKPQLEPLMYPDLFKVEVPPDAPPSNLAGSFDAFEATAAQHLPDFHLAYISVLPKPDRAWEGFARSRDSEGKIQNYRVFFDQYRNEWLGYQDYNSTFFRLNLDIHRRLMAGLPGRLLVEATTCWTIISVLTGLYLWIPRKKEKFWGVWMPRLKGTRRQLLKDWHTVPGFYFAIILILILVTGLLFTRVWGTGYLALNAFTGGFPDFYTNPPHSKVPEGVEEEDLVRTISIDEAYLVATNQYNFSDKSHTIAVPEHTGDDHAYQVQTDLQKPWEGLRAVFVDSFDGELLLAEEGANIPLRAKITLLFYPIHTGTIGGWLTQVVALIACIVLAALSLTGVWLWWQRRPKGKLGAPKPPPDKSVPSWIAWTTVALAIFLPTVGLTLLAIYLISGLFCLFKQKTA